jgi:hypothetical protein
MPLLPDCLAAGARPRSCALPVARTRPPGWDVPRRADATTQGRDGPGGCGGAVVCRAAGDGLRGASRGCAGRRWGGRPAGTWRAAIELPGTRGLNTGGHAVVTSVSCASAGNCAAGGSYMDGSGHYQAFVASEAN